MDDDDNRSTCAGIPSCRPWWRNGWLVRIASRKNAPSRLQPFGRRQEISGIQSQGTRRPRCRKPLQRLAVASQCSPSDDGILRFRFSALGFRIAASGLRFEFGSTAGRQFFLRGDFRRREKASFLHNKIGWLHAVFLRPRDPLGWRMATTGSPTLVRRYAPTATLLAGIAFR